METIKTYLNNLFAGYPKTNEILRAKEELLSNMEDKYNELKAEGKSENEAVGIVISEFGNIDELAKEWDIPAAMEAKGDRISVSRESAEEIIAAKKQNGIMIGLGVVLCMMGPALTVLLGGILPGLKDARFDLFDITTYGDLFNIIVIIPLFICVALGVLIFIISGGKMERYDYLKKNIIELSESTREYVCACKESYRTTYTVTLAVGVVLCILAPMMLIILVTLGQESDFISAVAVFLLLLLIAIAVFLFIRSGEEMNAYNALLQEGDFTPVNKKSNNIVDIIASVYWPIAAVIYFIWSFTTMNWGFTWIIWPIAGVLFGVIAAICNAVSAVSMKE